MSRYPAGTVAPRVFCPRCHRSIATTGDGDGNRWLRPHVKEPGSPIFRTCVKVGEHVQVKRLAVHYGIRVNLDQLVNQ